jgi:nitrate reductase assembly molybdenum cofactor insertion protein NarJ
MTERERALAASAAPASARGHRAACRAALYSLFVQITSPPTETLAASLCDGSLRTAIDAAVRGAPPPHRTALDRELTSALAGGDPQTIREAMLVEYTRFAGVPLLCPHYEADLIGGDSFRAVHIVSDVAAFYAAFGVQVSAVAHERPDYIGVELDFMRLLASKETYAAARGDRRRVRLCRAAQARFFEEHLGRWAAMFAENLRRVVDNRFYQAAAHLLLQFVAAETTYLAVTPRPIEPFANQPPDATTPAGVIPLAVVS